MLLNSSKRSNNFIHLWRLTWINTVEELEFLIIVSSYWRKRMVHPYKKNILKTRLIEILIFLLVVTVRYTISLYSAQNIRFLRWLFFHSLYFISLRSHIHHVCLYSVAIKRTGNIKENSNPKSFSKLRFSRSQKFVTRSVLVRIELQLRKIFKTSSCNLKIRVLGAKLCVAFLLFTFWK